MKKESIACILYFVGTGSFLTGKIIEIVHADPSVGKWIRLVFYIGLFVLFFVLAMKIMRDDEEPDEDRLDITVPYTRGMKCFDVVTLIVLLTVVVLCFMCGWTLGLKSLVLPILAYGSWLNAIEPQRDLIDAKDAWELKAYSWKYRVYSLLLQLLILGLILLPWQEMEKPNWSTLIPLMIVAYIYLISPHLVTRLAIRRHRKTLSQQ